MSGGSRSSGIVDTTLAAGGAAVSAIAATTVLAATAVAQLLIQLGRLIADVASWWRSR
ncbi:hypothetical protein [Streptomyces tateyamensis]|uniref:hypothetical protein n=1 Tax=Streptomyces tateyamensis TaxID=565073 RepID=UPI0015E8C64D|nr:hypothetical protein [Streptomyces tateyamensis]